MSTHATAAAVEAALRAALHPSELLVQDDSAAHAGHAGAATGSHFTVRLRCAQFLGLGRVARHRLVYAALGSLMQQGIHALAIEALDPLPSTNTP